MVDTGPVRHLLLDVPRASRVREAGNGSGSVVCCRQRLDAVRAVLAGAQVKEVASSLGVSRQSVHGWLARIWLRVLLVLRIGRIGRTLRRGRPVARWRSGWRDAPSASALGCKADPDGAAEEATPWTGRSRPRGRSTDFWSGRGLVIPRKRTSPGVYQRWERRVDQFSNVGYLSRGVRGGGVMTFLFFWAGGGWGGGGGGGGSFFGHSSLVVP